MSQDVSAKITSDTNNVLIGQPVQLTLSVNQGSAAKLSFPVFADTLNGLEILALSNIDTVKDSKHNTILTKNIIVTSFEAGIFNLEPLVISYNAEPDSDLRIIQTNSLSLVFSTVEVDTSAIDLRDIKPPIEVPLSFEDFLPYIAIVLGLVLIYYLIMYIRSKKRTIPIVQVPKYDPKIPADLEALEALQRLERDNLWQIGRFKEYHSRLTDILRVYIHRRYQINALEMTSGELIDELKTCESDLNAIRLIISVVSIADLAKFAKYDPSNEENVNAMKDSVAFVNLTKILDISIDDTNNDSKGGIS